MQKMGATDYETYREVMGELLQPIRAEALDVDTLKRLYESKLGYLENLRVKCFFEINGSERTLFDMDDYQLILRAVRETERHLRELILLAIATNLENRKIS